MGGHVLLSSPMRQTLVVAHGNMMDDVLISNLPPELLRSSLRVLVSQGLATQQSFVKHVRRRFLETAPVFVAPDLLFPGGDGVSVECKRYLALTRCIFSCKLTQESLPYMIHFIESIRLACAQWTSGSELESILVKFGVDIVQALQALKESKPEPTPALEQLLINLLSSLAQCHDYCEKIEPEPLAYPFSRAERQVRDVLGHIFPQHAEATASVDSSRAVLAVDVSKRLSVIETFTLGAYEMPRLFNGLWQLSSPAWGTGTTEKQEAALVQLVESGLTATDMADHYGDAELIFGDFRNKLPAIVKDQVYAATKWCVFGPINQDVTHEWVLAAVKERCRRLGGRVELLQFHWHDYDAKEYLDILVELVGITKSHPELVTTIGLCNFDSEHTEEACEHLLAKTGAVGLVSNQIQFSLFDTRPLQKMCAVADKYGLKLLTYGSFCGGFISKKWHNQPVPDMYSDAQITPSQRKYLDMINNWGSWTEFQSLLTVLSSIADKYHVSLTNIATRWVLQQQAVGAVIVGTRLGLSPRGDENLAVFKFDLDDADMAAINEVALGAGGDKADAVFRKLGDCGAEYRGSAAAH